MDDNINNNIKDIDKYDCSNGCVYIMIKITYLG